MITCYRVAPKEANMTGLAGFLYISKQQLRELIGKPDPYKSGDGKVTEHYTLSIAGVIVTIYDYKTGFKRLPMDFGDWNVGGIQAAPIVLAEWLRSKGFRVHLTDDTYPAITVS